VSGKSAGLGGGAATIGIVSKSSNINIIFFILNLP
jgi:hypothetical protein